MDVFSFPQLFSSKKSSGLNSYYQRMYMSIQMKLKKKIFVSWSETKILTCSCFFFSLNANSAKSFCGTSFSFGRSLAKKIRTCWTGQGGTTSSAIYNKMSLQISGQTQLVQIGSTLIYLPCTWAQLVLHHPNRLVA